MHLPKQKGFPSKTGLAEAEKIMAIGKSTAEAYELQVSAMGGDNFTKYKITEEIGKGKIKIIPETDLSLAEIAIRN